MRQPQCRIVYRIKMYVQYSTSIVNTDRSIFLFRGNRFRLHHKKNLSDTKYCLSVRWIYCVIFLPSDLFVYFKLTLILSHFVCKPGRSWAKKPFVYAQQKISEFTWTTRTVQIFLARLYRLMISLADTIRRQKKRNYFGQCFSLD